MNIRYRVICERIKARTRSRDWEPHRVLAPPATEEEIHATEEALGFTLPPMLHMLYLKVANGGDNLIDPGYWMVGARAGKWSEDENEEEPTTPYSQRNSLEQHVSRSDWRFPPETVEALRRHRGAYVDCSNGEGGFTPPDGFVYLAHMGCEVRLYLEVHTGHLYLEDWGHVSFCAPSVEDWLERDLDAPISVQASYHPHVELEAAITADEHQNTSKEPPSTAQVTQRLREENLTDDEPDRFEEAIRAFEKRNEELAKLSNRYPPAVAKSLAKDNHSSLRAARIKSIGLNMRPARYQLIRRLYELMEVLEDEIVEAEGEPVGEERFIKCLLPLIEAEANLAHMTWDIQMGLSSLYEHNRRDWRTGKVFPDRGSTPN